MGGKGGGQRQRKQDQKEARGGNRKKKGVQGKLQKKKAWGGERTHNVSRKSRGSCARCHGAQHAWGQTIKSDLKRGMKNAPFQKKRNGKSWSNSTWVRSKKGSNPKGARGGVRTGKKWREKSREPGKSRHWGLDNVERANVIKGKGGNWGSGRESGKWPTLVKGSKPGARRKGKSQVKQRRGKEGGTGGKKIENQPRSGD